MVRLNRGTNYDQRALWTQTVTDPSKISIDKLRLVIPVAKLDPKANMEYQEGVIQGLPITINYLKRRLLINEQTDGATSSNIKIGGSET